MIEPIVKIIENYNKVYDISKLDYSNLQYFYDKTKIFINGDWNYITTNTNNLMKTLQEKITIKNMLVKKINDNKYRLLIGPFKNFNALKTTYISLNNLGFDNLNVYKE